MNILSKYAHLIEFENVNYLFNVANGRIIGLNKRLYDLIDTHRADIDAVKSIHPDLYEGLVKCGAVVDNETDETAAIIERFEEFDRDPSSFGITINPTLDCNLRCWYCYETHGRGTMMSQEVLNSVLRLIDNKLADDRLKHLSISFFGGEPLLGWEQVVIPILSYSADKCAKRGVSLEIHFTTNGVLLSESRFDTLIGLGLSNTVFQISIDGNRTLHNNSRVNAAKAPTYDKIMANVAIGAGKGLKMNLRFNYTPETLASFIDVLSDLQQLPEDTRSNIVCSFHQVWQTTSHNQNDEVKDNADNLASVFQQNGFNTSSDRKYYRYVCYGDKNNHVVINYNGDLFKCTAREFSTNSREGVLTPDGIIEWNERYHHRMSVKYTNPICRQCLIMPICNGGCAQNKLERNLTADCPLGKGQAKKAEYLIKALSYKLSK